MSDIWNDALHEEVLDDLKRKIIRVEKFRSGSRNICMCSNCCKLAVREANDALDWFGEDLNAPYVRYVYDGNNVIYNTDQDEWKPSNRPDSFRWGGPYGEVGT